MNTDLKIGEDIKNDVKCYLKIRHSYFRTMKNWNKFHEKKGTDAISAYQLFLQGFQVPTRHPNLLNVFINGQIFVEGIADSMADDIAAQVFTRNYVQEKASKYYPTWFYSRVKDILESKYGI